MALGSGDHSKGLCVNPKEKWYPRWIQSGRAFICNVRVHRPYGLSPSYGPFSRQQLPLSDMGQAVVDSPRNQSMVCLEILTWFFGKNSFETGLCSQQHITECSWKIESIWLGKRHRVASIFKLRYSLAFISWAGKQPTYSLFGLSFAEKNGPSDSWWYFGNIKLSESRGYLTG